MDDRKLDNIERALFAHGRMRATAAMPVDFTARVMREVRQKAERGADFWDMFGTAARRFAPVSAVAATVICGYAQFMDRVLGQALLALAAHGAGVSNLAVMLP